MYMMSVSVFIFMSYIDMGKSKTKTMNSKRSKRAKVSSWKKSELEKEVAGSSTGAATNGCAGVASGSSG